MDEEKTTIVISFINYKLYRMIKASFTDAGYLIKFGFHDPTYTSIAKDFIDQKNIYGRFLAKVNFIYNKYSN